MALFEEIPGLIELEQSGRWDEAVDLLYRYWQDDKNSVQKLCRILFECWSVLIDPNADIQLKPHLAAYREKLIEVIRYGEEHFASDPLFLWGAGYCITLFPYLFYRADEGDMYGFWEEKGKKMLRYATEIEPDNLIARVFYYGCGSDHADYLRTRVQLAPHLDELLPGTSAIELYFKEMLTINDQHADQTS